MARKTLPMEKAVEEAALQNFKRDVSRGLCREADWPKLKEKYLGEASNLLVSTGQNYLPERKENHIVLMSVEEPPLFKEGSTRIASATWLRWYSHNHNVDLQTAFEEFKRRLSDYHGTLIL